MTRSWKNLFENVKNGKSCCSAKNLSKDGKNDMFVMKACDMDSINQYFKNISVDGDVITFPKEAKFVVSVIPFNSHPYVSLFCCNLTVWKLSEKIYNHGIVLEGSLKTKDTLMQHIRKYRGVDLENNAVTFSNDSPVEDFYLIIEDHKKINIGKYNPDSITPSHHINGIPIIIDGKPIIELKTQKTLVVNGETITGDRVSYDMFAERVKIDGRSIYKDSPEWEKLTLVHDELWVPKCMSVVAKDKNDDVIIMYFTHCSYYMLTHFLLSLSVKDAILLYWDNSSEQGHILWKEGGENQYNKTDFIGNVTDKINNAIVFASQ